jgi:hypothetical protein
VLWSKPQTHGRHVRETCQTSEHGKTGFIDVFWPGVMLAEQKSGGKLKPAGRGEVSNAEEQAFDYLNGGDVSDTEFPRYVVTSDFRSIQITDLEAPMGDRQRSLTFPTRDLPLHFEVFIFLAGYQSASFAERDEIAASQEAATLMGALYVALTGDADTDPNLTKEDEDAVTHSASVLMMRLLFLLFGDDAGLWSRGLFQEFIRTRTAEDGSDLGAQLNALFDTINTPEDRRSPRIDELLRRFPYINGGLFRERQATPFFDSTMRAALLAACDFEWAGISPAIFGSLFQAIKSKDARRGEGEHYTSEQNILKVLKPLFLDGLRQQAEQARGKSDERRRLRNLWGSLRDIRYVDPACGCGNFLVVAYREVRRLELDIILRLRTLDTTGRGGEGQTALDDLATEGLLVTLDQFYGIELAWWPAKIAETAMYLVDQQCNREMEAALGTSPIRLPITTSASIYHANALTSDWRDFIPAARTTYVFGNPPFGGHETRNDAQTAELRTIWKGQDIGRLDYVTAWYRKALIFFEQRDGEWAFVSTNSVAQGDQVPRLFGTVFGQGWRIKFAHRTFRWKTESRAKDTATVYCVIIGFTHTQGSATIYDYATPEALLPHMAVVKSLNGYLTEGPTITVSPRRAPLNLWLPNVVYGNMPRDDGNLLIEPDQYDTVMADRIAAKYVRPFLGAMQVIYNKPRWCLWLVDADPSDVTASPVLKHRLTQVREFRAKSSAASTRQMAQTPGLFGQRSQPSVPYVCIPRHVGDARRYFPVMHVAPDVIVGDSCFHAVDVDGFLFGIISSSIFLVWLDTVGGRIKGDPRFSNTLVWNTLPLP